MAYTIYNSTQPVVTQTGPQAIDSIRNNGNALRDLLLAGVGHLGPQGLGALMPGWTATASGGTAAQPTQWLYSRLTERIRVSLTWGSVGGSAGKITVVNIDYSSNSGSSYDDVQTMSITYDASGNITSATCTAT